MKFSKADLELMVQVYTDEIDRLKHMIEEHGHHDLLIRRIKMLGDIVAKATEELEK